MIYLARDRYIFIEGGGGSKNQGGPDYAKKWQRTRRDHWLSETKEDLGKRDSSGTSKRGQT